MVLPLGAVLVLLGLVFPRSPVLPHKAWMGLAEYRRVFCPPVILALVFVRFVTLSSNVSTILGISAFYHGSAACFVLDGEIIAAAQEERFTREKHDHHFPVHAARYCLQEAGLTAAELDYVGFYDKPLLKFD